MAMSSVAAVVVVVVVVVVCSFRRLGGGGSPPISIRGIECVRVGMRLACAWSPLSWSGGRVCHKYPHN